ncbi:MAG: hypothetical protein RMK29_07780 [Myxococcales bacterium]|nr:hypothetical protein [Myxococcales bacterium]
MLTFYVPDGLCYPYPVSAGPESRRQVRLIRLVQALSVLPLVLAPLLGGTAERPYTLLVAALCGGVGLGASALGAIRGRRMGLSWFAALVALALLLTLLQLMPLPPSLRALLAPGSDATLRQIAAELGGYPHRWHPLSLDPAATLNEAVRILGSLCYLLALGLVFSRRGDGRRLTLAVAAAALVPAGCGVLMALGVPLPPPIRIAGEGTTRALFAAGFVNSNHLAALLAVGAILCTALASEAQGGRRWLLVMGIFVLNIVLLGTLSRAGIAVGLCGQAVVLAWPGRSGSRRGRLLTVGGTLPIAILGFLLWQEARRELASRIAATRLEELARPGSKLHAWVEALPLLRGHLLLGVGRGAFDSAFQGTSSVSGSTRFVYLENEWLQAVLDWGLPGAAALGLLLLAALREAWRHLPAERGPGAPHRRAALVAIGALLLHNLVDFNLEVGGVALVFVALCAVVGRFRHGASPLWLGGLSLLLLAGAGLAWRVAPDQDEDGRRLLALARDPGVAPDLVVAEGRKAVLRHPLDSYLSAVVAARLEEARRPEAIVWVNRALLANPNDIAALHTAALVLCRRGHRAQGLRTLRHALERATYPQRQVLYQAALAVARSPADLLQALPDSPQIAGEVLDLLGASGAPDWSLLRAVAHWADQLGTDGARLWLAQAALAQRDVAEALHRAEQLLSSPHPPAFLLANLIALLVEEGREAEAESLARRALVRSRGPEVLQALALLRERQGQPDEARALLEAALREADGAAARIQVHQSRAALEERQGNFLRAAQERARAAQIGTH